MAQTEYRREMKPADPPRTSVPKIISHACQTAAGAVVVAQEMEDAGASVFSITRGEKSWCIFAKAPQDFDTKDLDEAIAQALQGMPSEN